MMFRRRCLVFVVVQARGISGALVVLNEGDGSIVLEIVLGIVLEIVRALFNGGGRRSVSACDRVIVWVEVLIE